MPVFFAQAGAALVGVLASMAAQLLTGPFLKKAIVHGLEVLVKKTETDEDDKLLKDAKQSWGMAD